MKIIKLSLISLIGLISFSCQTPSSNNSTSSNNSFNSNQPTNNTQNTPAPSPTLRPLTDDFVFLGIDNDKTSLQEIKSDGYKDLHFAMNYNFNTSVEISDITIYKTDSMGNKSDTGWSTSNSKYWILAVESDNSQINKNKGDKFKLTGKVKFDFYGGYSPDYYNLNLDAKGTNYLIEIRQTDSNAVIAQKVTI